MAAPGISRKLFAGEMQKKFAASKEGEFASQMHPVAFTRVLVYHFLQAEKEGATCVKMSES